MLCEAESMGRENSNAFLRTSNDLAWIRLGTAVRQRRIELGLTQAEAYKSAGVANGFWSQLENAKLGHSIRFLSAAGIESALKWKPGSVERLLLDDVDPVALEQEPNIIYLAEYYKEVSEQSEGFERRLSAVEKDLEVLAPLVRLLRGPRA